MKWWARFGWLLVGLVGISLLPAAMMYGWSWKARAEAARLLQVAKQLQPGVTSETEARKLLEPFSKYGRTEQFRSSGWEADESTEIMIMNAPGWFIKGARHMPFLQYTYVPPLSSFSVKPSFSQGVLSNVMLGEAQQPSKGLTLHVFHVLTWELSEKYPDPAVDRRRQGKIYDAAPGISSLDVYFDERASPSERAKALNFDFRCMTSLTECRDTRQVLDVAPTDD